VPRVLPVEPVGGAGPVGQHVEAGHRGDAGQLGMRDDARVGLGHDDAAAPVRALARFGEGPGGGSPDGVDRPGGRQCRLVGGEAVQWETAGVLEQLAAVGFRLREQVGRQVRLGALEVERLGEPVRGREGRARVDGEGPARELHHQ
jgi:hypothetical protein